MKRIAVLGNAGGGKSTLSQQLGTKLRIPCYSVDKALWRPGWQFVPPNEFALLHDVWISGPEWIIDGWGDMPLIEKRLALADTVILIEHPLWRHCGWALKRQVLGVFRPRADAPEGCNMLLKTWELVKTIRWMHRIGLPAVKRQIRTHCAAKHIVHLTSPEALKCFCERTEARIG